MFWQWLSKALQSKLRSITPITVLIGRGWVGCKIVWSCTSEVNSLSIKKQTTESATQTWMWVRIYFEGQELIKPGLSIPSSLIASGEEHLFLGDQAGSNPSLGGPYAWCPPVQPHKSVAQGVVHEPYTLKPESPRSCANTQLSVSAFGFCAGFKYLLIFGWIVITLCWCQLDTLDQPLTFYTGFIAMLVFVPFLRLFILSTILWGFNCFASDCHKLSQVVFWRGNQ